MSKERTTRPVGRPPSEVPSDVTFIRLPRPVREALQDEAKQFGVSFSAVIRETLRAARRDLPWGDANGTRRISGARKRIGRRRRKPGAKAKAEDQR